MFIYEWWIHHIPTFSVIDIRLCQSVTENKPMVEMLGCTRYFRSIRIVCIYEFLLTKSSTRESIGIIVIEDYCISNSQDTRYTGGIVCISLLHIDLSPTGSK